jgi:hypothetical protein
LYDAGAAEVSIDMPWDALDDTLLVDRFHELPYDERHTLDPLDLLLCAHQLPLQTPLLIFDVLFLKVDVPSVC